MGRILIWSDLHLGHDNMYSDPFLSKTGNGRPMRPFATAKEADDYMIAAYNRTVKEGDKVYFLGDVAITKTGLDKMSRMRRGRKYLVLGNHDKFGIQEYMKYFSHRHIYGAKYMPEFKIIMTHVPIHPLSLNRYPKRDDAVRWTYCCHGHFHDHIVVNEKNEPDPRYVNCCVEHTNYEPKLLEELIRW